MGLFADKLTCSWCLRHALENCHKRSGRRYRQQRHERVYGGYHLQLQRQRHRSKELWRPWVEEEDDKRQIHSSSQTYSDFMSFGVCGTQIQSPPQFQHPVKLVWPKKPYDYMYAEGERLLRDFPVQATLEFALDSDSESDDEDDDAGDNNNDNVGQVNQIQSTYRNDSQDLRGKA